MSMMGALVVKWGIDMKKLTRFDISWSDKYSAWVATCSTNKSFNCHADNPVSAINGLFKMIDEVIVSYIFTKNSQQNKYYVDELITKKRGG